MAVAPRQRMPVTQRPGGLDRPGGLVESAPQHGAGGQVEVGVGHRLGHLDGAWRAPVRPDSIRRPPPPHPGCAGSSPGCSRPGPPSARIPVRTCSASMASTAANACNGLAEMGVGLGPEQKTHARSGFPRGRRHSRPWPDGAGRDPPRPFPGGRAARRATWRSPGARGPTTTVRVSLEKRSSAPARSPVAWRVQPPTRQAPDGERRRRRRRSARTAPSSARRAASAKSRR